MKIQVLPIAWFVDLVSIETKLCRYRISVGHEIHGLVDRVGFVTRNGW